jgi:outer membrane protein OmpA-like peptidoglycan-associated protein
MRQWLYFSFFTFLCIQAQANEVVLFEEPPTAKEILESFGEPTRKTRGDKKSRKIIYDEATSEAVPISLQAVQQDTVESVPKPKKTHKVPVAFPLTFAPGSAELSKDAQKYIDSMAEALKQKADLSIHISGHTDISGGDEINKPLSLKRAESVQNYLKTAHQIEVSRLEVSGEGSAFPIDFKEPHSPANRRVQFDRILKNN